MSYQIIEANKNHIDTIAGFQIKMAWETEKYRLHKETITKGVSAVFAKPELGKYFVVLTDEEIIASLLITYEWSDWRNVMVWWIQSVFVTVEHRRKGVFNMMYEHIKTIVINDPKVGGIRLYVDKTNLNAQKTYNKVGMNGEHYQLYEWMKD